MLESWIVPLIFLLTFVVVFFLWRNRRQPKVFWTDDGTGKPFFHSHYRVVGKPDWMAWLPDGTVLLGEHKPTARRVEDSHLAQVLCAALAARGNGYRVSKICVKTLSPPYYKKLPETDEALFRMIEPAVLLARAAKQGLSVRSNPHPNKCRSCSVRHSCRDSAA